MLSFIFIGVAVLLVLQRYYYIETRKAIGSTQVLIDAYHGQRASEYENMRAGLNAEFSRLYTATIAEASSTKARINMSRDVLLQEVRHVKEQPATK